MSLVVRLALLFATVLVQAQSFTVVQINAEWNSRNTLELPYKINGAKVVFAALEDQPKELRDKIKAVPVILVYKDSQAIGQFMAGIDFKLYITEEDIKKLIDRNR